MNDPRSADASDFVHGTLVTGGSGRFNAEHVPVRTDSVGPLPSVGQSRLGVFVIGVEHLSDIDRVEPAADHGLLFVWVNVDRHVLRSELPPAASEPESGHMEAGDFAASVHARRCYVRPVLGEDRRLVSSPPKRTPSTQTSES